MGTSAILCEPRQEPSEIRAGDTVSWQRYFLDYPASGGFSLAYALVSRTVSYDVSGDQVTADGDRFVVTIPAATTAQWMKGFYRWQAYITDGNGNRWTVDEGVLRILPNLQQTNGQGYDDREMDEKILAAIKDLLAGKVLSGDAQRYMIHGPNGAGRELQRYTFAELEKLRGIYARRVREIRIRRGERVPSRTLRSFIRG